MNKAATVFEAENPEKDVQKDADTENLYATIGQLKIENDWLKKNYSNQDPRGQQIRNRQSQRYFAQPRHLLKARKEKQALLVNDRKFYQDTDCRFPASIRSWLADGGDLYFPTARRLLMLGR